MTPAAEAADIPEPGRPRAPVLAGLRVVDLSWGIAGPLTTMLLGDHGADVVKVEPPGGDPFRATPGYTVWNRSKQSVVLDLHDRDDRAACRRLIAGADVVVESFSPGTTARLGVDYDTIRDENPGAVYCSITAYGRTGAARDRPGYDALVQARWGLQDVQPGHRPGPVFLHLALPSFGAALVASVGIHAALLARDRTGRGQWVETSLAQGALTWMTQIWNRAETPTPTLTELWRFKDFPPTPCFEAGDGKWFHPMPQGIALARRHLGDDPGGDPDELPFDGAAKGDYETRRSYFAAAREVFLQRDRDEWVALLQANDVSCQPIGTAEAALDHPQVVHNGASVVVDLPGVGPVKQFGHAYRLEHHDAAVPIPPPAVGEHSASVLASLPDATTARGVPARTTALRHPLEGIRVLDFGTALAGPFGPMVLSDLGADVIKVDPLGPRVGTEADATYAACQRGKRSIAIDLKTEAGQRVAHDLIASADVLHYNLRTGVAERLGFGYEQAKAANPTDRALPRDLLRQHRPARILAGRRPDGAGHRRARARAGRHRRRRPSELVPVRHVRRHRRSLLGHRRAAGAARARPYRGRVSRYRPTSSPARCSSRRMRSSAPSSSRRGRTSTASRPGSARATGCTRPPTAGSASPRCATSTGARCASRSAGPSSPTTPPAARRSQRCSRTCSGRRPAAAWFEILDAHGVPCEVSSETWGEDWYDDPEVIEKEWVTDYRHAVWGRLEQPGRFLDLSDTPTRIAGPPPVVGAHTREILARARLRRRHGRGLATRRRGGVVTTVER